MSMTKPKKDPNLLRKLAAREHAEQEPRMLRVVAPLSRTQSEAVKKAKGRGQWGRN